MPAGGNGTVPERSTQQRRKTPFRCNLNTQYETFPDNVLDLTGWNDVVPQLQRRRQTPAVRGLPVACRGGREGRCRHAPCVPVPLGQGHIDLGHAAQALRGHVSLVWVGPDTARAPSMSDGHFLAGLLPRIIGIHARFLRAKTGARNTLTAQPAANIVNNTSKQVLCVLYILTPNNLPLLMVSSFFITML